MDNLPAHKVQEIRNIIEEAGIKVLYLSPYSSEFNPIENCWSKIKEFLRGVAARTRDDLELVPTSLWARAAESRGKTRKILQDLLRNYFL